MQKEIDSAIVIYPQVLEKAFNEISDITEIKKKEMFQTIIINDKKWFDLVKEIKSLLGINRANKSSKNYWLQRGHSVDDSLSLKENYSTIEHLAKVRGISYSDASAIHKQMRIQAYKTFKSSNTEERIEEKHRSCAMASLEVNIEKYGLEEGTRRYNNRVEKFKDTVSNFSIEKKNNIKSKIGGKLEDFIDRHGLEEGTILYNSKCKRVGFAHSLQGYIEKYGLEEGTKKFNIRQEKWVKKVWDRTPEEIIKLKASLGRTFEQRISEHGLEKALERITKNFSPGKSSKESRYIFIPIYKWLRRLGFKREDFRIGLDGSSEARFYNYDLKKLFLYDFTVESLKVIIEYNGTAWHPKTRDGVWHPKARKELITEEQFDKDQHKIQLAIDRGYSLLTVWSDTPIEENILRIKEFITEKIKIKELHQNQN